MRVIAQRYFVDYWAKHPDAEQPLKSWYDEVAKAEWQTPQDIKFVGTHQQYDPVDAATVEME